MNKITGPKLDYLKKLVEFLIFKHRKDVVIVKDEYNLSFYWFINDTYYYMNNKVSFYIGPNEYKWSILTSSDNIYIKVKKRKKDAKETQFEFRDGYLRYYSNDDNGYKKFIPFIDAESKTSENEYKAYINSIANAALNKTHEEVEWAWVDPIEENPGDFDDLLGFIHYCREKCLNKLQEQIDIRLKEREKEIINKYKTLSADFD